MDIRTDNIDNIKALMANILDGHNGENLYAYLAKFNSLNVGYVANAKSAREAVPEIFRKNGLYITYYINNKPTTEIFIGDKTVAGNETEWVKDEYWEFSDGIGHVDSNSITLNQLSKEVLDLICANNEINIVNYPDGEDLTEFDVCGGNSKRAVNALRFANKEYNPANFSGLGKVYLRKNIVDIEQEDGSVVHKNILTQDMINKENTQYVIQYDYDLNGEEITIPNNCVLKFENGKFSNGNVSFNNTAIFTDTELIPIFNDIIISGDIYNNIISVDWFNNTLAKTINTYSTIYNIICNNNLYNIEQSIIIGKRGEKAKTITFKNRTILNVIKNIDVLITLQSVSAHSLYLLNNLYIKGNNLINTAINVNDCTRILLKDIVIYDFNQKGVELFNCRADLDNLYIESDANENTDITGLYMNAGDCTASNIELCNMNKCVKVLQGNNRFFRIHGWINSQLTKEYWDTTCLFFIKTTSYTIINDCVSDSPKNFIQADDSIGQNWSKIICTDCGMMYYNRDDISGIIHNNKSCAFNKTSNVTVNCYNFCVYWYTEDELDIINNVAPGDIVTIAGNTTHGTDGQYLNNITGTYDYNNIEWNSSRNERYISKGGKKERILRYAGKISSLPNGYSDGDTMLYNGIPRWFNGSAWVDEKGFLARYNRHGITENRPNDLSNGQLGFEYYDQTIGIPIIWNGKKFINYTGFTPTLPKGETNRRPSKLTTEDAGVFYFDTTLNKPVWWNGTEWIEGSTGGDTDLEGAEVTNVETLESTEEATATATIADNKVKFTFAIPRGRDGANGQDGQDGAPGKDGVSPTLPNYSIYRYRKSDSKPAAPTGTSQNPSGWTDIPNDAGNWWQCVGEVNGATGAVTRWGEVLPLNGRDGTAQDGKYTEMRFAVNTSRVTYPTIDRSVRTPSGWTLAAPSVSQGQYLWMTTAIINPNDTLNTNWNIPVCISGPTGAEGATGPAGDPGSPGSQGPAGIPGVDMLVQYCVGTDTHIGGTTEVTDNWTSSDVYVITDPSYQGLGTGWYETIPDYDPSTQYIWCTQGKREYTSSTKYTETWNKPFRLNGLNGLNGEDGSGKRGQIVYPAGIYDNNTAYVTDENKAPYVLDTTDGYYYVLNAIMTWRGSEQGNRTPSQDYAINSGKYWLKFEGFNAIYAKIGIIANGLVGSAVFNGDWMFSQAGQNSSGGPSTQYENFNPSNPYGGAFRPNVAINLKTGEVYFGCDKTRFGADGSGKLANGNIKWDADGNIVYNGLLASLNVLEDTNAGVTYADITLPHLSAPDVDSKYQMEYTYVFGPKTRAGLTRRVQLEERNDTLYYNGGTFSGSGILDIEEKIPSAYGFIKFICRIDGQDNAWYMVVVKDCNP